MNNMLIAISFFKKQLAIVISIRYRKVIYLLTIIVSLTLSDEETLKVSKYITLTGFFNGETCAVVVSPLT